MSKKHKPSKSESSQEPGSFSELLRYYRKRAKLTQLQLQMRLTNLEYVCSISAISMWETGERLPNDLRLFHYLGKVLSLSLEEEGALIEACLIERNIRDLEDYLELKESKGEVIPPGIIEVAV